jgi:hypothetical protein
LNAFKIGSVAVSALLVVGFAPFEAQAKCSRRIGDSLIAGPQGRFQCAKPKSMISFLHNNLITPYSFSCAEKLRTTCKSEGCENPASAEEERRCQGRYVAVLNSCVDELDGAAVMAKCKDTRTWAVRPLEAEKIEGTRIASVTHPKPAEHSAPNPAAEVPVALATPTSSESGVLISPSTPPDPALTTISPPAHPAAPPELYGPPSAAAPKPTPLVTASPTPPAAAAQTPSGSVEIVSRAPIVRPPHSKKIRIRRTPPRNLREI